jgi:phosphoribosylformylglycinamidine synthase
MKQKYRMTVIAPGTVIISAGGNCTDIRKGRACSSKDGGAI